ncbi:hypothetical protein GMORB2_5097 [Geosmithia morbida]|uniref:Uncharacterized protein n=1 Tax=Geosmithia morbida TaxID=1094350 RepID=A0A9P4YWL1_9HYPO|nr:uncharacterized protein GMORB2_5097 [Geosmithia morbida]KAF4124431.1 hypothetical protein GMORB2_5097 [Geosmithia morbida]
MSSTLRRAKGKKTRSQSESEPVGAEWEHVPVPSAPTASEGAATSCEGPTPAQ